MHVYEYRVLNVVSYWLYLHRCIYIFISGARLFIELFLKVFKFIELFLKVFVKVFKVFKSVFTQDKVF